MMNWLRQNIFLVDSLGAIGTALGVGVLVPLFEIGVPTHVLQTLALIAVSFAVYSGACFLLKKSPWPWLAVIAFANAFYCLLAWVIAFQFAANVTPLGWAYFSIETVVIAAVVFFEMGIVRNQVKPF